VYEYALEFILPYFQDLIDVSFLLMPSLIMSSFDFISISRNLKLQEIYKYILTHFSAHNLKAQTFDS
jgi:hypothetical protein